MSSTVKESFPYDPEVSVDPRDPFVKPWQIVDQLEERTWEEQKGIFEGWKILLYTQPASQKRKAAVNRLELLVEEQEAKRLGEWKTVSLGKYSPAIAVSVLLQSLQAGIEARKKFLTRDSLPLLSSSFSPARKRSDEELLEEAKQLAGKFAEHNPQLLERVEGQQDTEEGESQSGELPPERGTWTRGKEAKEANDQLAQWGLRLHPEIKRSNTYDVVHVSLRDLRVRDPRGPSLFTEAVDTILSFIKGLGISVPTVKTEQTEESDGVRPRPDNYEESQSLISRPRTSDGSLKYKAPPSLKEANSPIDLLLQLNKVKHALTLSKLSRDGLCCHYYATLGHTIQKRAMMTLEEEDLEALLKENKYHSLIRHIVTAMGLDRGVAAVDEFDKARQQPGERLHEWMFRLDTLIAEWRYSNAPNLRPLGPDNGFEAWKQQILRHTDREIILKAQVLHKTPLATIGTRRALKDVLHRADQLVTQEQRDQPAPHNLRTLVAKEVTKVLKEAKGIDGQPFRKREFRKRSRDPFKEVGNLHMLKTPKVSDHSQKAWQALSAAQREAFITEQRNFDPAAKRAFRNGNATLPVAKRIARHLGKWGASLKTLRIGDQKGAPDQFPDQFRPEIEAAYVEGKKVDPSRA